MSLPASLVKEALKFFQYDDYKKVKLDSPDSYHIYVDGKFKADLREPQSSAAKRVEVAWWNKEKKLYNEAKMQIDWLLQGHLVQLFPHPAHSRTRTISPEWNFPPAGTAIPLTCHKIFASSLKALQADNLAAADRYLGSREDQCKEKHPRSHESNSHRAAILQLLLGHSDYLLEHSLRCEALVKLMLRRFFKHCFSNLVKEKSLIVAALAHDLGRLAVYDTLSGKAGELTPRELYWMNRHPLVGLAPVAGMLDILPHVSLYPIICHHLTAEHVYKIGQYIFERMEGDHTVKNEFLAATAFLKLADAIDSRFALRPHTYHEPRRVTFGRIIKELIEDLSIKDPTERHAFPLPETERERFRKDLQKWLKDKRGKIQQIVTSLPLPRHPRARWR